MKSIPYTSGHTDNKKSGQPPQTSRSRIKCRISRGRSCPSLPIRILCGWAGVSRYAVLKIALKTPLRLLFYYNTHPREKSRRMEKKYGDDTHPQARENMVIQF